MRVGKYINNISSLQLINFLRFFTFLIVSIIFTKSTLTPKQIGDFEMMMFIAGLTSFFWVTGLIQSFLSLYNNNDIYPDQKPDPNRKSPEIFNAFIVLAAFSLLLFILGHSLKNNIYVYKGMKEIPYVNLLLFYLLLNNPTNLIEYIYVLKNKSRRLFTYALVSYGLQLIFITVPVILDYGVDIAFSGLLVVTVLRFIWLMGMLKKYAEFTISWPFIKAHLKLATPLIISTLLSGSAQYIDNLLVAINFNPKSFAFFRYGAKEFPLVVMLASGLHSAMIPEFANAADLRIVLARIRHKTRKLINALFPLSMLLLVFSNWIFIHLFNPTFRVAADVFMVYLLLIISRLLFPQTILIGLQKTKVMMITSIVEIVLNTVLSIIFIRFYGITGTAVATVLVFLLEKLVLIGYINYKLKIKPHQYIPVRLHLVYSIILIVLFILIDHRILKLY